MQGVTIPSSTSQGAQAALGVLLEAVTIRTVKATRCSLAAKV